MGYLNKLMCILTMLLTVIITAGCGLQSVSTRSSVNKISEKRYTFIQMQKDYKQLQNIIEKKHPKLYTNREELAELFETQYTLLKDGMGVLDFYRILSPIAAKLNCGHTVLSLPEEYENYLSTNGSYLPFAIRVIDNRAYIIHDYSTAAIPEGSEITEINGKLIGDIINIFLNNISADGSNLTKKYYIMNYWFNGLYNLYIDNAEAFLISYKKPGNNEFNQARVPGIKDPQLNATTENIYLNKNGNVLYSKEYGDSYASLKIKTFDLNDSKKYKAFIDEFFKELKDRKIQNLILDLRDNWGGSPEYSSYLFSYLISNSSPYMAKDAPFYYYSLKNPVKPAANRYNGKLYTLINGASFSSTGHLSSLLKFYNIGVFIGEESGGSFACTDASHVITLKHTKIRLHYSTTVFKTAVSGLTPGRGIIPDYTVLPTVKDYIKGIDVEMNRAQELIKGK